ncbi:MAG: NADH:flavin oxidoreductase [Deltaproteobacteria bacterium]|jgi:2,4-dienoyl-CoA reductase-like NADH-dependent reductase (Old Yellow Enzyme family)|nr:NADH:flavin oxidoreductase [Deltaproteobacteria bacterium]
MKKLLEPLNVPGLKLKNRLVMPPMATSKGEPDGSINQAVLDYYRERTKDGLIGLVITEHFFVRPDGQAHPRQLSAADDGKLEGLKRLAEVVNQSGSPSVLQISHAGGWTSSSRTSLPILAPSAVPHPKNADQEVPRAMTDEDVEAVAAAFAAAAGRAKKAGFSGVELHAAHGFLLYQFFTPLLNRRQDRFGGSVQNRLRLILDVYEAVRQEVGGDYPILVRLGGSDYAEGGVSLSDVSAAAKRLETMGVPILDVSGGLNGFAVPGGGDDKPGYFAPLAEAAKKEASLPVILTGGVTTLAQAEKLLEENKADLIGVGRAIFHDPDWARREFASFGR